MDSKADGGQEGRRAQLFAVKVAGGQEANVAKLIADRARLKGLGVYSVIASPKMRGYLIVEADNVTSVNEAISGVKNVKSVVPGVLSFDDVTRMVARRQKEAVKLSEGELVEVTSGPFKGMRARVVRFNEEKQEATINLVDVPYQLQVTVDANYLRKVEG